MQIKSIHGRYFAILRRPDGGTHKVSLRTRDEKAAHSIAEKGGLQELEYAALAGGAALDAAIKYSGAVSAPVKEAIEEFLEDLRLAAYAPNTIENYSAVLMPWMLRNGIEVTLVSRVKPLLIDTFVNTAEEIAYSTRCYRLTVLNLFFLHQIKKNRVLHNPCSPVGVRRHELKQSQLIRKKTHAFTVEEYDKLVVAADQMNFFWHFMLVFGRDSALRPSDIASMEVTNVEDGKVRLFMRKTGREVSLPVTPRMQQALDARPPTGVTFLFPDYRRAAQDPKSRLLQREFRVLAKKAGVTNGSLRSLRKMGAMQEKARVGAEFQELIEREAVRRTAEKLGHVNTSTTERHYLQP